MSKARDLANAGTALTSVSATELGYVDGVTSAIQTQIDTKIAKTLTTTTGDTIYASGANTPARLGIGSTGQVLTVAGGVPSWASVGVNKNWTAIANYNFGTTNAASYTFSGLSGYDNYIILQSGLNFSSANSGGMVITINGDSGSNYIYQGWSDANATVNPDVNNRTTGTYFDCKQRSSASNTQNNACIQFSGTNSSGYKWIEYDGVYNEWSNNADGARAKMAGFWIGSGTVTSIKINYTQTANAGTLYLYGSV